MRTYETEAPAYSTIALIRDLWSFLGARRWKFLGTCILAFTGTIVWLYPPYAMSEMVNLLTGSIEEDAMSNIQTIFLIWALVSVWHYGCDQVVDAIGNRIAERTALEMQLRSIAHLLRLDLTWHEKENAGSKLKKIQRGTEGMNRLSRIWFRTGIPAIVRFGGMIPILAAFDLRVGFTTFFFLLTYFAFSYVLTGAAGRGFTCVWV